MPVDPFYEEAVEAQTAEIGAGWKLIALAIVIGVVLVVIDAPNWTLALALVLGLWGIWRVAEGYTQRQVAREKIERDRKDHIAELETELERRPKPSE